MQYIKKTKLILRYFMLNLLNYFHLRTPRAYSIKQYGKRFCLKQKGLMRHTLRPSSELRNQYNNI